jgi:sec-independent protein translocase protein TatB
VPSIGSPEVFLCLVVALIVLGPEQLPKAARQLGRAIGEVKKFNAGLQGHLDDLMSADDSSRIDDREESGAPRNREASTPNRTIPDTEGFRLIDGPSRPTASDAQMMPDPAKRSGRVDEAGSRSSSDGERD